MARSVAKRGGTLRCTGAQVFVKSNQAAIAEQRRAVFVDGTARRYVHEQIGIVSTLIDRERVSSEVTLREWAPYAETV